MRSPKSESLRAELQAVELEPVLAALDRVRREWHAARILSGMTSFLSALLAAALLVVLVTMWLPLPPAARWSLRTAWIAAVGICAILFVFKRLLENPTDEDVALLIERARPDLHNELINAVRLAREPGMQSPPFVSAAIRESGRLASSMNTKKAVSWRVFRRRFLWLVAILALWAGLAFAFPARCTNAFSRLVRPNANLARVGSVRILEVTPGDATVIAGENVEIRARIEVSAGAEPTLVVRHAVENGPVHEEKMTAVGDGTYACVLLDLNAKRTYRVAAGDSLSRQFTIAVTERPIVTKISVKYWFPKYTAAEPTAVDDCGGVLRAVKGTLAEVRIAANKRLAAAAYIGRGEDKPRAFRLDPGREAGRMGEDLTITENAEGRIEITDEFGCRNARPVHIVAADDTAPKVRIASPASDRVLGVGETLELAIRGSDDFGVAKAELVERRLDPAASTLSEPVVVQSWTAFNDPRNVAIHWNWPFDEDSYRNGEIVRYYVRMTDGNDITGPGVGASGEFLVRLEDAAAKRKDMEKKYNTWQADLEKILKDQKELRRSTAAPDDRTEPETEGGERE